MITQYAKGHIVGQLKEADDKFKSSFYKINFKHKTKWQNEAFNIARLNAVFESNIYWKKSTDQYREYFN